jgi:ribosomal protein L18
MSRCSWNTTRKKERKESNISMKKYHHRPTLGVKSGRRRLVVSKNTKKTFAQRGELH